MIKSVSELLNSFIEEEKKKLNQFGLKHGPTIGDMYEGLTSEVLDRAIPKELNLKITSGVIYDDTGTMTGEIDCMLVQGDGIQIPYTNKHKWHIKDVIVVLEVKKTLYSNDLRDAFCHLREIVESHSRYLSNSTSKETFNVKSALRTFSEITSTVAPSHDEIDSLDFNKQLIYHNLITEHTSPIRIVLGYNGFQSELALRNSLKDFLEEMLTTGNTRGFGVGSFPQLIISGYYSLVKMDGQPFSTTYLGEEWNFYASSRSNPILLLLEIIWTRLSRLYNLRGLWGEDLEFEAFAPFLKGKAVQQGQAAGWMYSYDSFSKKEFLKLETSYEWEPTYINKNQHMIIAELCSGKEVNIGDKELISYIEEDGVAFDDFLKGLLSTGLIALNGKKLQLTTEKCQCMFLPTGECVAGENNSGRLTRWAMKRLQEIRKNNES